MSATLITLGLTPLFTAQWEIHPISDGKYKIKTGGSYVGVLPNGYISAFLLEDMLQGEKWKIQPVSHHGENAYMCVSCPLLDCVGVVC